jgi:hypothetical protein
MFSISHKLFLIIFCICLSQVGIISVLAEIDNDNTSIVEDTTFLTEGVTIFMYSPAGFSLIQPEGITATIDECPVHTLVNFLRGKQSVLSVDVNASNSTLNEIIAVQKDMLKKIKGYSLISEGEKNLSGQPGFFIYYKYSDKFGEENLIKEIISVNNGYKYILITYLNKNTSEKDQTSDLINSFKFVPIGEDSISKMIKTKMTHITDPSKFVTNKYTTSYYDASIWGNCNIWCNCNSSYIYHYSND